MMDESNEASSWVRSKHGVMGIGAGVTMELSVANLGIGVRAGFKAAARVTVQVV